jgi:protease-4
MSESRKRGVVGLVGLIGVLFFIFLAFSVMMLNSVKMSDEEFTSSVIGNQNAPIAVVKVEGVIMDATKTVEELIMAEEDKTVKAIIVRIDSPGGVVGPTQEIYEEMVRIDEVKPVFASFGSVAASGGYYIGAAARKIYSTPGVMTGSIGVIMQFMDLSQLYEWAKVKPETIKAGTFKDIGSPSRAMTEDEKKLMSKMLDVVHKQFRDDIMKRRGDRIKGDIAQIAQGQIYSGTEALELGLVDELAGMWEAGRKIYKDLDLSKDGKFGLRVIKKKDKFSWGDFLENVEGSVKDLKYSAQMKMLPMYLAQ